LAIAVTGYQELSDGNQSAPPLTAGLSTFFIATELVKTDSGL